MTPYTTPASEKQWTFNRLQGAPRKDVERLVDVVTGQFDVALHPARFVSVRQLNEKSRAIAILHKMVVELRRKKKALGARPLG